jgi:hypothetical protein
MILQDITKGFTELIEALTYDLGVWWLLTPIILLWIAMEVYFGEYKQEQLGFSSTLANGFTLFWISLTSFRVFLFIENTRLIPEVYQDLRFYILGFFVLYSLFVIYISFTHRLSIIAPIVAGPSLMYFFSILSVLWGQRLLDVSLPSIYALAISYLVIIFLFFLIRRNLGLRGEIERIQNLSNEVNNHA